MIILVKSALQYFIEEKEFQKGVNKHEEENAESC